MQNLTWYYKRLKKMSAQEISWRVKSLFKDSLIRIKFLSSGTIEPNSNYSNISLYRQDIHLAHKQSIVPGEHPLKDQYDTYINIADDLCKNKLSYFNLHKVDHGTPQNWHFDFENRISSEKKLSVSVNYRDLNKNGDCKYVWEPNRHHQLLSLAVAYRYTLDQKYLSALKNSLLSWIQTNPYGFGMNWRSPLELGIRLINWVFMLDLIKDENIFTEDEEKEVIKSIYLHLTDITSHYSKGSSANNHLVGEAAGVFIAASYFSDFPNSALWIEESKAIIEAEIYTQSFADGCIQEYALGYQFFVLQFYLYCGYIGHKTKNAFSADFYSRCDSTLR